MHMNNFDSVKSIKRGAESRLLKTNGVHGVSIGEDKKKQGHFCIYLHVDPMTSAVDRAELPKEIEGVKVIVSVEEMPVAEVDTNLYRPLVGGSQINAGLGNGTLGCLVKDRTDGKICILSNQHAIGYPGTVVGQPTLSSPIGKTIRSSGGSQHVDGAIAEVEKSISSEASILEIGDVTGTYDVTPQDILGQGYPVSKRGRSTGLTHSFIKRLDYSGSRKDGWSFKNQLYVNPVFSAGGDSGSAYVNSEQKVVGLHWGASSEASNGSPIAEVIACLDIDVLTIFHAGARANVEEAAMASR